MTYLVVPGWGGSSTGHWQSHWETVLPDAKRVDMVEWEAPRRDAWIDILDRDVRRAPGAVVVVAHSLGCIAVAHWARAAARAIVEKVRAAWLVAPPDLERPGVDARLREFAPVPRAALPFPSKIVGSTNDAYLSPASAAELAGAWGSELELLDGGGHINVASGHGPWPEGRARLSEFVTRVDAFELP